MEINSEPGFADAFVKEILLGYGIAVSASLISVNLIKHLALKQLIIRDTTESVCKRCLNFLSELRKDSTCGIILAFDLNTACEYVLLEEVEEQIALYTQMWPDLEEFFKRPDIIALVEQQLKDLTESILKLADLRREGKIDHAEMEVLLKSKACSSGKELERRIEAFRHEIRSRPAVSVEFQNGEFHQPRGQRFFMALSAIRKKEELSIDWSPTQFGFFDSLSDYLANPHGWLKNLQSVVHVRRLRLPSLGSAIEFAEYETEKFPERTGSGETGLSARLFLNPRVYDMLKEKSPRLEDYPGIGLSWKFAQENIVIVSVDCTMFSAPAKRKFQPMTSVPNAFKKKFEINNIQFEHLKRICTARKNDNVIADAIAFNDGLYRKLSQWGVKETESDTDI